MFFNTNTPTVTIFLNVLGDRIRLFAKKRYGKLNRFCDVAGIRQSAMTYVKKRKITGCRNSSEDSPAVYGWDDVVDGY